MTDSGRLSPKKRAFVRAILTEKDTRAAAKAAGIAERTGYRWIADPTIQAAIVAAESDALQKVTRGLLRLAGGAVDALDAAMPDSEASASAKVRAADVVLSRLLQLRELVTLDDRLTALEETLSDRGQR